jgi:nicotinamide-nucleotide amidase
MERSLAEADLVLVTGGLGPTSDDLTRDYAASLLGLEMVEDAETMERIRRRLAARGRQCGEGQRRQAMVPAGARVLPNERGTAPGLAFSGPGPLAGKRARLLCLLPGPPSELHPMFVDQVLPLVREIFVGEVLTQKAKEYHFAGIGEGELAAMVDALNLGTEGIDVGYCAHSMGTIELRLTGSERDLERAEAAIAPLLGEDFYSRETDSLERVVVGLLGERGETVAVAESCTGGAVCSRLTDIPGSSAVFGHGFITYANSAKIRMLEVAPGDLDAHGAVSEVVALAMAEGARAAGGATYGLALTGIAGPGGGTADKPVGTVWIAVSGGLGGPLARRHVFNTDRGSFKRFAATHALDLLRRRILSYI